MGYQAIRSGNKILLKSYTTPSSSSSSSLDSKQSPTSHPIHLPSMVHKQSPDLSMSSLSSDTRRESLVSPGAVLPPLDPQLYHHPQQQSQIPHQEPPRRNTEPSGEPSIKHEKSPLNPFQQHHLPGGQKGPGITLPPLSTIAPKSMSSPSSTESRSRGNSLAEPAMHHYLPSSQQAPPVQQQQHFHQQQGVYSQHPPPPPPPPHPSQQQQQQQQHQQPPPPPPQQHHIPPQPVYSPPYPIYTSLPVPRHESQDFAYPGYVYPPNMPPPKDHQQIPVSVVYQAYRPQYGHPIYLQQLPTHQGPPPPLPHAQQQTGPGGHPIHQIVYHPGFAFDNAKKIPRRRTRTGCLTCRKRRIKCDERKPHCVNCEKSRKVCLGYEQPPFQNRNRKYKDSLSLDTEIDEGTNNTTGIDLGQVYNKNPSGKERISAVN